MPLPSSGQITIDQIHIEAGGSSASQAAINDADIRDMIAKGSGAQNAFNEYYGVSATAPVATYKGRTLTTGNGFPTGNVTLSSGSKLVVVTCQLAGGGNTYVNVGGVSATLAAKMDTVPTGGVWGAGLTSAVYYLVTSASGSTQITGNGGSGRSVTHVWEITGYNSSTPTATASAQNTDNTSFSKTISLSTQYNGVTIGSGITEDTNPAASVTVSNSDTIQQIDLESATNHFCWDDEGTASGTTSYNCVQNNPASNIVAGSTIMQLSAAHWK